MRTESPGTIGPTPAIVPLAMMAEQYLAYVRTMEELDVEVAAEGKLLVLENVAQPGMVGSVGTILGKDGVNIAELSLSRLTPGGTAYMVVRVDTELSHLGSISVRLSGLQDGPMAITLLADGPGGQALAEALPGLAESLQQLGMVAGLRVASLAADDGHG